MRIASAISVQRPGPTPVRPAMARVLPFPPVTEASPAPILQAVDAGDAAWLTLLMAQAFAGPRRIDPTTVRRAYGAPVQMEAPILMMVA